MPAQPHTNPDISSAPGATAAPAAPEHLWREITRRVREALWRRQHGERARADEILRGDVPRLVTAWSSVDPRDPAAKRLAVSRLIADEQRRTDDAFVLLDLIADRLVDAVAARLEVRLSALLRSSGGALGSDARLGEEQAAASDLAASLVAAVSSDAGSFDDDDLSPATPARPASPSTLSSRDHGSARPRTTLPAWLQAVAGSTAESVATPPAAPAAAVRERESAPKVSPAARPFDQDEPVEPRGMPASRSNGSVPAAGPAHSLVARAARGDAKGGQRIPLGDVAAMIDFVRDSERATAGR